MLRNTFKSFAVILGGMSLGLAAPPTAQAVHVHRFRRPFIDVLPRGPAPLAIPEPGTPYLAPEAPSSPSPTEPPTIVMPTLPEGMVITVTRMVRGGSETVSSPAPDSRSEPASKTSEPEAKSSSREIALPKQAAQQLADCWSPPLPRRGDTVEITLRFGFNSKGEVLWPPRVTYVKLGPGMSGDVVRASILDAVKACTPLHFSPAMAANIPGEPLSVRFIGRREEERREPKP
jgi:hypothetical protein